MRKIFLTVIFSGMLVQAFGQLSLDFSGGFAAQSYNKVRVPGAEGTAFDLYKEFETQ